MGDLVDYTYKEQDTVGLISNIQKRNSFLSRARVGIEAEQVIAANIDKLFIADCIDYLLL